MSHIIVENTFEQPLTDRDFRALMCGPCFEMYGVYWQDSLLSDDGRRMLCWFKGPDAESVRIALRNQGLQADRVWSGIVRSASGGTPINTTGVNLVVETRKDQAPPFQQQFSKSTPGEKCPRLPNAWLECTMFSLDGRRQLCLFRVDAGDPGSEFTRMNGHNQGLAEAWTSRSLVMCLAGGRVDT